MSGNALDFHADSSGSAGIFGRPALQTAVSYERPPVARTRQPREDRARSEVVLRQQDEPAHSRPISCALFASREEAARRVESLSPRQHQIMEMVVAGQPNKVIAWELGISQRTVENHRATIMHKTGSKSLASLIRLAFAVE
jgi:FixJ family two-component response regulator